MIDIEGVTVCFHKMESIGYHLPHFLHWSVNAQLIVKNKTIALRSTRNPDKTHITLAKQLTINLSNFHETHLK